MSRFLAWVKKVCGLANAAACVVIVLTMLLVVGNILLRALFNAPMTGTYELVGFLSVLVISSALAKCALSHSHIAVDILVNRLPEPIAFKIRMGVKGVSAAGILILSAHLFGYARDAFLNNQVSATSQVPLYPFAASAALGLLLLAFAVAHQMAELAARRRKS